jgi:energy-coupling factor transporter ATP-binding protein EcfA2
MHITKVVIKNYRCLQDTTVDLNAHLNIIVGNNECGKSTFLEAVNLALSGLLNGRSIHTELHTHLFNADITSEYIQSLKAAPKAPPSVLIELYLDDADALARLGERQIDLLLLAQAFLDGVEDVATGGVIVSNRAGIDEARLDGDRPSGDIIVRKVSPADRIIFDRYRLN